MNNFLALDTSTNMLTVALSSGGERYLKHELRPREHGQLILSWIEALLQQAGIKRTDLQALFVGVGPGGFTGIRIGVGVAQGIAAAMDCPVVGVSSLQIIAQSAADQYAADHVIVAQDARMGEVYWGLYRRGDDDLVSEMVCDQLAQPNQVHCPEKPLRWLAVGDAWSVYQGELMKRCERLEMDQPLDCYPHAGSLLALGERMFEAGDTVKAEQLLPVYLRGTDAWKKS